MSTTERMDALSFHDSWFQVVPIVTAGLLPIIKIGCILCPVLEQHSSGESRRGCEDGPTSIRSDRVKFLHACPHYRPMCSDGLYGLQMSKLETKYWLMGTQSYLPQCCRLSKWQQQVVLEFTLQFVSWTGLHGENITHGKQPSGNQRPQLDEWID